jgi:hypothetical protein
MDGPVGKVRLRELKPVAEESAEASQPSPMRPLRVSGVVVRKADLVEALRVYMPALADLAVTEDGESFWLILGEGGPGADPPAR